MKIISWKFKNLIVPMIQDDDGKLWCTNKALAEALGITPDAIRVVAMRNKDKLQAVSITDSYAKDFIRINKVRLGLKRIKKDMLLWSDAQMIRIALWSRSEVADQFTDEIVEEIRSQATTGYVLKTEFDKLSKQVSELTLLLGQQVVENESLQKGIRKPEVKLRLVQ